MATTLARNSTKNDGPVLQAPAQRTFVERLHAVEGVFAPAIERVVRLALLAAQHAAAEHRREGDRDEAGEGDGKHDGDGEFMQQPADDAAHEDDRDEHRGQ